MIVWLYPGGLTREQWYGLSPAERLAQWRRFPPKECKCEIREELWPPELFEFYSYDPYIHMRHLQPHDPIKFKNFECECETCEAGIGLSESEWKNYKRLQRDRLALQ